jgi:zinc D-Ala-D-Ala carboxypeptidase
MRITERTTAPHPRRHAAAQALGDPTRCFSRRAFIGGAVLAGGGVGLALLGALPETCRGTDAATNQAQTATLDSTIAGDPPADAALAAAPSLPRNDWRLTLVNPSHPIDPAYTVPLAIAENGFEVDERCLPDLERMLGACRDAGLDPFICSAYRTQEMQEYLFEQQVQAAMAEGLSAEEARRKAGTAVAMPGTSEHQLGLALDIVDFNDQNLTDAQADTPAQRWLLEHSWEYGFIFRYAADKTQLTGIIYEPWHYRYVGPEVAEAITKRGLCLEEFLA